MSAPLLGLEGLTKRYGSLAAVSDVSLTVEEGQRHALIGPNGAGKSTLFSLVAGTLAATSGRISFRGEDVTRLPEHRRAQRGIAKTFQHSNLFGGLTATENVAVAVQRQRGAARSLWRRAGADRGVNERSSELLATVGLGQRADALAGGLSHGERRQLEVAMALACEPSLILLDEPTAGMSLAESGAFVDMVARLPGTSTVLIIEHDLDVVFALATRISVLHVGRLLASGPPEEIRNSSEVQEAYLGAEHTEDLFTR